MKRYLSSRVPVSGAAGPTSTALLLCCCILTVLASGPGCLRPRFATLSQLQERYSLPAIPKPADYPEDDAVVVLSTIDNELYYTNEGLHTDRVVHRVVRILRNPGSQSVVEVDIFPGEELVGLRARIHDPNGAVRELGPAEIDLGRVTLAGSDGAAQDDDEMASGSDSKSGSGSGSGSGDSPNEAETFHREKNTFRFLYPNVVTGSTLEYRYRLRRSWPYVFDTWAVQEYDPVLYTHYTLKVPTVLYDEEGREWDWRYRLYRCARIGAPEIYEEQNPGLGYTTTYRWSLRDVGAFRPEPRMPAHSEELAFARFADKSWDTWDAVSEWYTETYLEDALAKDDRTSEIVADIVPSGSGDEEKLRELVDTVLRLETVELELGQGRLTPTRPPVVFERGRGDVKDKAILLVALLREAGFQADPALVITRDRGNLDRPFPNWSFNHMLVLVENGPGPFANQKLWIDPTAQHQELGELPWRAEGVEAVVLRPDYTADLQKTPMSTWSDNRHLLQVRMQARADSSIVGEVDLVMDGEAGSELLNSLDSATRRLDGAREVSRTWIRQSYPDATVERVVVREPSPGQVLLSFRFLTRDWLADDVLPRLAAAPLPFDAGIERIAEESRRYPVDNGYAATWTRRWSLDLSESPWECEAIPSPVDIENRDLLYRSRVNRKSGNLVQGEDVLEVRRPRIKTRNYKVCGRIVLAQEEGGAAAVLLGPR